MPEILSIIRYRILKYLMSRELSQPQAERLGRALGSLVWALDPVHRKVADTQLSAALGPDSPGSLAVMRMQGEFIMEALRLINQGDQKTLSEIKIYGREHLERAREQAKDQGRGIMVLTAHIGPWEVMSWIPKALDFPASVMADQRDDWRLEELIKGLHAAGGATILPPKGGMLKQLTDELKAGRSIAFMPDQRSNRSQRVLCDFFDMPAPTNPAGAFIALSGDAIIVPSYALKHGHEIALYFEPPFDSRDFPQDLSPETHYRDAWKSQGVQELSAVMQKLIEDVVRREPAQWFWVHSRWTRRSEMKKLARKGLDFKTYIQQQAAAIRTGSFGQTGENN